MNRSYSKIRHIQNVNMLLESRRRNIFEETSSVDENMLKQITNGYLDAIMDDVNIKNMYDEKGKYIHRDENLTIDSLDEDTRLDAYLDVKEFVGMIKDDSFWERLGEANNGFHRFGQRFWDARKELLKDKSKYTSNSGLYTISFAFDDFGPYKKMLNDIVSEFEPAEVFVEGNNIFVLTGDELKKHKEELEKSKTTNNDSDYPEENY